MKTIKKLLLKIKFGYKSSGESFSKYLIKKGVTIGRGVRFYAPWQIYIDIQYPFLINICDNVVLAPGVRVITHDYSWHTLNMVYKEILGASGPVEIGENTFVGSNVTILKNTKIGKNCIIGAGSLVIGEIPDNSVACGVPAKVIMSTEDFYKKRKTKQLNEAYKLFEYYYEKFHLLPNREIFSEYFWLYCNNAEYLSKGELKKLKSSKFDESINKFINFESHKTVFRNYNEFIDYCKKEYNKHIGKDCL